MQSVLSPAAEATNICAEQGRTRSMCIYRDGGAFLAFPKTLDHPALMQYTPVIIRDEDSCPYLTQEAKNLLTVHLQPSSVGPTFPKAHIHTETRAATPFLLGRIHYRSGTVWRQLLAPQRWERHFSIPPRRSFHYFLPDRNCRGLSDCLQVHEVGETHAHSSNVFFPPHCDSCNLVCCLFGFF